MQFSDHPRGAFLTESDVKSYTLFRTSYTVVASIKGSALATALYTYCQLRSLRARRSGLDGRKPTATDAVADHRRVVKRRDRRMQFRPGGLTAVGLYDCLYGSPGPVVGLCRALAHIISLAQLVHDLHGGVYRRGPCAGRRRCLRALCALCVALRALIFALCHGTNPYAVALHM